ncbi:MAG TPA: ABC transporter ATP-binding protein [Edaphocola sp.]|nr:ABC transporter ATP-binding protein [Edaphocola sp.]
MNLLYQYLSKYKVLILIALLLAVVNQVFSLLTPAILGNMIIDPFANKAEEFRNASNSKGYFNGILYGLALIIGAAMVSRIAKALQDYVVNVIIQKFGTALYNDGLKHSLQLPFQDFEDQRSGETLSILIKARADCEKLISNFINVLFATLVGIVFVGIIAYRLHPSLPLIYLVGAVVLSLLISVLSKRIKSIQRNIVNQTTSLAGSTTESLRNIELVKSLGLTDQEIDRLNNNSIKILNLELKKVKSIRSISFVQGTFVNFLQQTIMFALLFFLYKDVLSLGQLMMMQFYSFFIFGPLQEIGNIILNYREAEASLENLKILLDKPVEKQADDPAQIEAIKTLSFKGVSFQHLSSSRLALDNVDFEVRRGQTYAFVGPSGSGKTTMVKLLLGLYKPSKGTIEYNNIDASKVSIDSIRKQLGLVTQDIQLFSGTIRENLKFVSPEACDEDITQALEKAAAVSILNRSENGLDTVIGEGGLKLSGGERQRLSIARALLRKPDLLIFDEATSALDSLTEKGITETIENISKEGNQITILIAHRLSTVMHADKIFVLERGKITRSGTHEELVKEKGLYYAMWRQQVGGTELEVEEQY